MEQNTSVAASSPHLEATAGAQNTVIPGSLWVGTSQQQPTGYVVYVNGPERVDGYVTAQGFALQVNGSQTALLVANNETPGQIGVTGASAGKPGMLRVQTALGVGTDPGDDLTTIGQLVVRADLPSTMPSATASALPLQVWQDSNANGLGAIDATGRFGLGPGMPTASLTVQGAYRQQLGGTVWAEANIPTLHGIGTSFDTELHEGDWVSIPGADPSLYQVVGPPQPATLTLNTKPLANIGKPTQGQPAYCDDDNLLRIQDAAGDDRLTLDHWGDLVVVGATTTAGLTVNGATQITNALTVGGSTTLTGLTTTGSARLGTTLSVGGDTTISGNATVVGLTATGNTTLGGLTVNGATRINNTVTVSNAVVLSTSKLLTTSTADNFQYQNQTMGQYALGWFNDPWNRNGSTGWLSGYAGIKLFANGALAASVDQHANLVVAGSISGNALATNGSLTVGAAATVGSLAVSGAATVGSLTVSGAATIAGGLAVPGANETLRMVRGNVYVDLNSGGIIRTDGAGFSVAYTAAGRTGQYLVTFNPPFPSTPSVSVTQVFPNIQAGTGPGDPLDNAIIFGLTNGGVWIATGNSSNRLSNRSFSFVVMGPR